MVDQLSSLFAVSNGSCLYCWYHPQCRFIWHSIKQSSVCRIQHLQPTHNPLCIYLFNQQHYLFLYLEVSVPLALLPNKYTCSQHAREMHELRVLWWAKNYLSFSFFFWALNLFNYSRRKALLFHTLSLHCSIECTGPDTPWITITIICSSDINISQWPSSAAVTSSYPYHQHLQQWHHHFPITIIRSSWHYPIPIIIICSCGIISIINSGTNSEFESMTQLCSTVPTTVWYNSLLLNVLGWQTT